MTDFQRDTAAAISDLTNATQADHDSMASLTDTVTTLTSSLASANNKLVQALAQITVLEKGLAAAKANKQQHASKVTSRTRYCSTHSPKSSHSSDKCRKKGPTHNDLATDSNRMGGREKSWPTWNSLCLY